MAIAVLLAALLYTLLGASHLVLALRDLRVPRSFTPTDVHIVALMQGTGVVAMPGANLWRAWLGFNLSHSLGLLQFAGILVVLALKSDGTFWGGGLYLLLVILVAAAYLVVAARFFFRPPTVVASIALTCLIVGFVL